MVRAQSECPASRQAGSFKGGVCQQLRAQLLALRTRGVPNTLKRVVYSLQQSVSDPQALVRFTFRISKRRKLLSWRHIVCFHR